MTLTTLILWAMAAAVLCFLGGFALVSMREGEPRATRISALLALLISDFFVLAGFLPVFLQRFSLFRSGRAGSPWESSCSLLPSQTDRAAA